MSDRTVGLGEHESWYVDEVTQRLRSLPDQEGAPLRAVVRANLSERPPSDSREQLLLALGPPADYADRLRSEAGVAPATRARRAPSPRTLAALGLGLAVLVVAGIFAWRWWTADPGIYNSCAGISGQPPEVTVERREAAGSTEQIVGYADGAELAMGMCLSADEPVTIVDVTLNSAPHSLFQPSETRMRVDPASPDAVVPFEPVQIQPTGADSMLFFYLDGRLTDCEHFGEGTGVAFNEVMVTYDFHGRRRTTAVEMDTQYSFVSPPDDQCPRPRDPAVSA